MLELSEALERSRAYHEAAKKNAVENYERMAQENEERIARNHKVIPTLLEHFGDAVSVPTWDWGATVTIDLGEEKRTRGERERLNWQLSTLRDLLGNLTLEGKEPVVEGGRKRVRVRLVPEGHPGIAVTYLARLKETSQCRIVKTRHKAFVTYDLVCERGG